MEEASGRSRLFFERKVKLFVKLKSFTLERKECEIMNLFIISAVCFGLFLLYRIDDFLGSIAKSAKQIADALEKEDDE